MGRGSFGHGSIGHHQPHRCLKAFHCSSAVSGSCSIDLCLNGGHPLRCMGGSDIIIWGSRPSGVARRRLFIIIAIVSNVITPSDMFLSCSQSKERERERGYAHVVK